ncbi:MAG TPA: tryptophan synthase subunit alpha [Candidatus Omnitrophica bacterium]|nr:MAG: tryptophan synthase subunit alpha [Omnitrophica WOR_2 bacterium GWA2_45_18]HBR13930.1 tryptophan synthase subunit alpha [Candidatus Omnitrophota bacterium]
MNRIDKKFKELKERKKKAFIAFITAGDPNLKVTEQLVLAFEASGVDIVELGVPFSDPLADGPVIQASSQRALKQEVNLRKILDCVKRIRGKSQIPLALMTYYNPVFHYGEDQFVADAREAGVDGVIIPDLPPEESKNLIKGAKAQDLSTVFFISPTTTPERMKRVVNLSTGFIYYVSLTGVTGARNQLSPSITRQVEAARKLTDKPICVGFGVSSAEQVSSVSKSADGVIVGSAIINAIVRNTGKRDLVKNVSRFVARLACAV